MAWRTVSTMMPTELRSASRSSTLLTSMHSGSPVIRFRPRMETICSCSSGYAEPASIFTASAICSPMSRLYFCRL